MDRRTVLKFGIGTVVVTSLSGCLARISETLCPSPSEEDSLDYDLHDLLIDYWVGDNPENHEREFNPILLAERTIIEQYIPDADLTEADEQFLADTDFDEEFIILVQIQEVGTEPYQFNGVGVENNATVTIFGCITSPDDHDDISYDEIDTFLLRISRERVPEVDSVEVTFQR